MTSLFSSVNPKFWYGRTVAVTGHTGFKGSWLFAWLSMMGARVTGYALPPNTTPNLFEALGLSERGHSVFGDVGDSAHLKSWLNSQKPECVFHLAAQPIVRLGYEDPVGTYRTNVMGTVHVLEAVRQCPSVRVLQVITTDKCYENEEHGVPFVETDRLGGHDPYSSSKACAEEVARTYREAYGDAMSASIATVRTGNVIGGGDWAPDRLVPNVMRASQQKTDLFLRYPKAVRPWQYVLEPLYGYLLLAQHQYESKATYARAFNFAPMAGQDMAVSEVVALFCAHMGKQAPSVSISEDPTWKEANTLRLNGALAKASFGYQACYDMEHIIADTWWIYQTLFLDSSHKNPERAFELIQEAIQRYLFFQRG